MLATKTYPLPPARRLDGDGDATTTTASDATKKRRHYDGGGAVARRQRRRRDEIRSDLFKKLLQSNLIGVSGAQNNFQNQCFNDFSTPLTLADNRQSIHHYARARLGFLLLRRKLPNGGKITKNTIHYAKNMFLIFDTKSIVQFIVLSVLACWLHVRVCSKS